MEEKTPTEKDAWPPYVLPFLAAFARHWTWWAGSTTFSVLLSVIQGEGGVVSPLVFKCLAGSGFIVAAFLAWFDERRKFEKAAQDRTLAEKIKEGKMLLRKCAEALKAGEYPLHALMLVNADEMDTNEELIRFCDDLKYFGFRHPFDVSIIGGSLLDIQDRWLDFLQEARFRGYTLVNVLEVARVRAKLLDVDTKRWYSGPLPTTEPPVIKNIPPHLLTKSFEYLQARKERITTCVEGYKGRSQNNRNPNVDSEIINFAHSGVLHLEDNSEVREVCSLLWAAGLHPIKPKDFERDVLAFFKMHWGHGLSPGGPFQVNGLYSEYFDDWRDPTPPSQVSDKEAPQPLPSLPECPETDTHCSDY